MITILFSGGFDSMVLAEKAKMEGTPFSLLHFSYGQSASGQEAGAATLWAQKNDTHLERKIVSLCGIQSMNTPPGTTGPRVIPGRNLLLLSLGINYAAANGSDCVWFGATRDDWEDYPDCRPEFVDSLNALSIKDVGVKVQAPFIGHTKKDIVLLGRELGVSAQDSWSCYSPRAGIPCQECNSCIARNTAFQAEA
jgi:7-cyano-7-deazaguanine synthase